MKRKNRSRKTGLGEVTKRDFVAIADILCAHGANGRLALDLAGYFKSQNPRFDAARFVRATTSCKGGKRALAGNGCSEGVERAVHLALRRASDLDEHDTHFRRAHRFAWDAVKSMNDGDCESAGDLAKAAIKLAAK